MRRWVVFLGLGLLLLVAGTREGGAAIDSLPDAVTTTPVEFGSPPPQDVDLPASEASEALEISVDVEAPFDMIGLLWDSGQVSHLWLQVRDKSGAWGEWIDVPVDPDHAPDEGESRFGSSPVYTGSATAARFVIAGSTTGAEAMLISTQSLATSDQSLPGTAPLSVGAPPAPSWTGAAFVKNRSEWDTQDCRREGAELNFSSAKAIVIHHTAASNSYSPSDVPGIILGHCLYHVNGRGWDDIGYNFLVDRFGTVWEGRTGSKTSPIRGAHTAGFNSQTQGVAMMGNFDSASPTAENIEGLRQILEWLTGWHSIDPEGSVTLVAGAGAVGFEEGEEFSSASIVGHRDLGSTTCPGGIFYATLASLRTQVIPVNFGFDPKTLVCDGKAPTIFGTPGNDVIWGTDGADVIHSIYGHDWVFGLEGDDSICGSAGDDVLIGGSGFDRLFGGSGSDACGGEFRQDCETVPNDEFFFYRSSDGVFKYYNLNVDASLGAPIKEGVYSLGWDSITAVDLTADGQDEFFFYRSSDGVFKYYDVNSDGSLGAPIKEGVYSLGWDSITKVDLDGDSQDEFFFYRSSDGVFKYYDVNSDGSLGAPIKEGVYSLGWDSITAVDLDGDSQDEFFFYRSSTGTFKYYHVTEDASLGLPVREGLYSLAWDSITAVELDPTP